MKRLIPLLFLIGVTSTPALAEPVHEPTVIAVGITDRNAKPDNVLVAQADTAPAPETVQVEPFVPPTETKAPVDAPPATEQPAPAAAVPDPVEDPAEAAGLLYRLYKAGHLVPAIIVALFLLLTLLQRWVEWLRTGWRRLAVTAILGGSLMLVERAAEGTTPNLLMLMGAIGSILTLYMQGKGEPKQEAA